MLKYSPTIYQHMVLHFLFAAVHHVAVMPHWIGFVPCFSSWSEVLDNCYLIIFMNHVIKSSYISHLLPSQLHLLSVWKASNHLRRKQPFSKGFVTLVSVCFQSFHSVYLFHQSRRYESAKYHFHTFASQTKRAIDGRTGAAWHLKWMTSYWQGMYFYVLLFLIFRKL